MQNTTQPNKPLAELLKKHPQTQADYDTLDDEGREFMNLWAELDPTDRKIGVIMLRLLADRNKDAMDLYCQLTKEQQAKAIPMIRKAIQEKRKKG